jgi:hypothetical protein
MANFFKRKYGLIFALISLILGLPFFHYHPDNSHTHQSELSEHTHKGHFHSNELSGFVELINHNSSNPLQKDEHHPHSDTDTGTNYFDVNLQKSSVNPVKTFKLSKTGNVQKLLFISEPALVPTVSLGILALKSTDLSDTPKERSPPFLLV